MNKNISIIIKSFDIQDRIIRIEQLGNGHINETFKAIGEQRNYVLQRINQQVFPNPVAIMENMALVAKHLKQQKYPNAILEPYSTWNGNTYIIYNKEYWRILPFVENTIEFTKIENVQQAFAGGQAFGMFLKYLKDIDISTINTIIPNFHSGTLRWQQFIDALGNDLAGRKTAIQDLIDEIISLKDIYIQTTKRIATNQFPIRLTHNDTKITNILFDKNTNAIAAVLDWDTIMPNTVLSDFGDMVRTFCNTAKEDETDLSLIEFRLDYFEALLSGFSASLKDVLTKTEKDNLVNGGFWITYMQVLRFITDYLNGDIYYTTKYPNHNLDRAISQFHFYKKMLAFEPQMSVVKTAFGIS